MSDAAMFVLAVIVVAIVGSVFGFAWGTAFGWWAAMNVPTTSYCICES